MPALANLHGKIMPLEEVRISPLDRGFLFGDSIYEVLRIYAGRPFLEQEHWVRLKNSLAAIRLPGVDLERLRLRMHETIKAGNYGEATVYLQITRGAAVPRKHAFPKDATPLELLWVQEFVDPYAQYRKVGCGVSLEPDLRWKRCDIKSTNLLGNILAMQTAVEAGNIESLLYYPDGTVTEGTHSSFFAVDKGTLVMTPSGSHILPGMTRDFVVSLAKKLGVGVREAWLKREQLFEVEELFLTGTTSEVLPIARVDGRNIGPGAPGPITRRLQEAYTQGVHDWLGE